MKKRTKNGRELYRDCSLNKWKCDLGYSKKWVNIFFRMFSFHTKSNATINNINNINYYNTTMVKQNFIQLTKLSLLCNNYFKLSSFGNAMWCSSQE